MEVAMSRVLIADDHAVVRAGYKHFLATDPVVTEVGEASSGNETMEMLRRQKWDLLMMDISMPGRGGLDILNHVTSSYPGLRILIVSGLPEEQYARNVLRAGASGYLDKAQAPEELLKAVHLLLKGRRYVSTALAESMAADLGDARDPNKELHASLSTREFQIFCKLASGETTSAIARELSLSMKTISTYRKRVLEKMSFVSNAQMTSYAMRTGLLPK
jgi:two-component system, NarL family, invasion response regulator UvrY